MRSWGRGLLSENPHELADQLHDPKRLQIVSRKDSFPLFLQLLEKRWAESLGVAWLQRFKGDRTAASHLAPHRFMENGFKTIVLRKGEFLFCAILTLNESTRFILRCGESQFYDWFALLTSALEFLGDRKWKSFFLYIVCQHVHLLQLTFFSGVGWGICTYFIVALFCSCINNYFIIFIILEFADAFDSWNLRV